VTGRRKALELAAVLAGTVVTGVGAYYLSGVIGFLAVAVGAGWAGIALAGRHTRAGAR
jgi:hypothetical protein